MFDDAKECTWILNKVKEELKILKVPEDNELLKQDGKKIRKELKKK